MNAKIASFFLVLLCLCSSAAHAVNVRFLAWDDGVAKLKVYVVRGDHADPITDFHPLKRTVNYQSAEGSPLKLRLDGKKNPDGTAADLEVNLMGMQKPLVLVLSNDKAASGLAAVVINDDETNFKWGSFMVFNATKGDLAMVVDGAATKVPTGWRPVVITPKGTNEAASIQLRTYKEPNKVAYSMVWPCEKDARLLVILIPSTDLRLGEIATKTVPETRAYAAAEREIESHKGGNSGANPAPPQPR